MTQRFKDNVSNDPKKLTLLDVRVDSVTMEETLDRIAKFIRSGEPHLVVTLGTEMVMFAQKNFSFRELIERSSLVVADGGGIVWAARRIGKPVKEKVAGIDVIEKLCSLSGSGNWRIFFLGGKPGIAETAAKKMKQKYPDLQIAGTHHGYFKDEEVIPIIANAKPDILLAGMGFPKQELWLSEHLPALRVPVGMGVGGSFDVLSGNLKRAPRWMIALNLEWLFRLFQEPERLKRISILPRFVWEIYSQEIMKWKR